MLELFLTILGGLVGGYGGYRRDPLLVGVGVVLLACAMLAIHYISG